MPDFLNNWLTAVVTTFVAGFGTWFFAKRKYRAETSSIELQNMQALYDLEQKKVKEKYDHDKAIMNDLENRLKTYITENRERESLYLERESRFFESLRNANDSIETLSRKLSALTRRFDEVACFREPCKDRINAE